MKPPNTICVQCGATHIGGTPFHGVIILNPDDGKILRVDHYCATCEDYVNRAMWPEDREPYPGAPILPTKGTH